MMTAQGKGDTQRPCDKKTFDENYNRIFGKGEVAEDPTPVPEKAPKVASGQSLETLLDLQDIRAAILQRTILDRLGLDK
jgi:hypothetical protein